MLNLNKTLVDFLEQAIEFYIMVLPQQYALPTQIEGFQQGYKIYTRACPHFKNGDKNKINCRQTRKIAQLISGYYPAI